MHALSTDASLVPVFAHRGPFVTVYLDASHGVGDGPHVIDARWAAVRETLDGADPDSLDAIEESLTAEFADTGAHGLVVVAAEGELCLTARMATPPADSAGFHTPLPFLLPYLASRPPHVPNVVVVTTAGSSRLFTYASGDLRALEGAPKPQDVDAVPRAVARLVSRGDLDVVVVVGDAASRAPVVDGLRHLLVPDVTVRSLDLRGEDTPGVRGAVEVALREQCRGAELDVIGEIRAAAWHRNRVVFGVRHVAAALRMAQVDAVLLSDGDEMQGRCWVGPRPTEFGPTDAEAASLGLRSVRHDRTGSALVRAVFATDARLATMGPGDWQVPHGVAALLR